jgi:DNA-binding response OmpR family regulator
MAEKILVVDDEITLLRPLCEFLQGEGFNVVSASNGQQALRLAYNEQPNLVVLDVVMPGMEGWEVAARLREMSNVPIILVTARSSEADKLRGFKLGVDDYVIKPFSFAELTARVRAVLKRTGKALGGDRRLVMFGDFVLDLDKREVRRQDETISLTPTEYRLLEALAEHEGRAVAEFDLIKEVWGAFREEETAAVRRYIFLLRQKIEEDPTDPKIIVTVRGYGYRLEIH